VNARIAGLYAITPDLADTDGLLRRVRAALDGGARVLDYRIDMEGLRIETQ